MEGRVQDGRCPFCFCTVLAPGETGLFGFRVEKEEKPRCENCFAQFDEEGNYIKKTSLRGLNRTTG